LESLGYEVGPTDPCVFVKQVGGRIFILLLYVDDILAIVDKEDAERITAHLVAKFGTVVFERNGELSYLGMEIEISDEGTKIDMSFYVRQIIGDAEERSVLTEYESPGTKETFVAQEGAGILCKKSRIYFHSTVAKLLYLAKRARPDILTVVTYLCTRVQCATVEDERKLGRILGYLKGTVGRTLLLKRSNMEGTVAAYVDAAYALHADSKSHTGVVIYVGGTLAYVASRKQKCMSKSPTEAELIALTDNLGLVELFQEFVEFVSRKKIEPPVVYQDCNAVVTLVTKGGGKLRTKHLRARMHLGKEMVDEGRIAVVYKSAEGMEADGFSKPYDPAKHKPFAAMIQGEAGQQVGAMQNGERSQAKTLERSGKMQGKS
jgi:ribosomal protein L7Ae-like RNA K-turn-binding protein